MTTLPISTPSPKPSQQQLQRRAERVQRRRRARKREIAAAKRRDLAPPHELRVLTMPEAVQATSLSEWTLRRRYRRLIVKLSPGRVGIRFADVQAIVAGEAEAA